VLDVRVDITGAKDICGLIVHVFAVELRCVERLLGAAPCPMSNSPPAASMTFSVSPTPPPGNSGIYRVPVPQRRSRALKSQRPASRAEARRDASRLNPLSPWAYCGLR
jgi:hypothetical protein